MNFIRCTGTDDAGKSAVEKNVIVIITILSVEFEKYKATIRFVNTDYTRSVLQFRHSIFLYILTVAHRVRSLFTALPTGNLETFQ